MDKAYFPIFVDISTYKILVVGGGAIAARRVKTLVRFAEDITVIAPDISTELKELEASGKICCVHKRYEDADIADMDMVLAATNSRGLNRHIAEVCRETEMKGGRRILLSVADDRGLCDFYFPAIVQTEDITIGINSGGIAPGRVKELRRELEEIVNGKEMKNKIP